MKRLFSALSGLVLLVSASGCCCDWCNCCNPCRPSCSTGCSPCGGSPATAYLSPTTVTTTSLPTTYGTPVATASITPYESLPTY